ncbi:MAG: hypothetical protein EOP05_04950 [Proteobacteria bacterium]|nr:MAG: hypothetical protein EOP05_04950 [Pseudomonadota bacterium]
MKLSSTDLLKEGLKTLGSCAYALALALSVCAGACSAENDRFQGDVYRIPWPDSDGVMAIRPIEIKTLNKPEAFEGSAAKILVEPSEGGGKLVAEKPRGRFIRASDGAIIPADFMSLQAVTAYAHQERLMEFDRTSGVDQFLQWPLTIGLQVKVVDRGNLINNNAIYDGKLDALLLVPYTASQLPIAFNGGILGHEHFHFVFQKAVLNRLGVQNTQGTLLDGNHTCAHGIAAGIAADTQDHPEESKPDENAPNSENGIDIEDETAIEAAADEIPPQIYNSFVLRSLNEGLADFWGWAYSNDNSFVGRSLPSEDRVRRLDLTPGRLSDTKALRESLVDLRRADKIIREDYRIGRAYLLGTQYARFLRQMVDSLVEQGQSLPAAKLAVAQAVSMASIGTNVNYEMDTAGRSYEARMPFTLRLGYQMSRLDLYGEYSYFSDQSSGTQMVQVGNRNYEFLMWGRTGIKFAKQFKAFGALGLGAHKQIVETTFDTTVYRDPGQLEAMAAVASGIQWRFAKHFDAIVEARLSTAQSYQPNPTLGLGAYLGVLF